MSVVVRKATKEDMPDVLELIKELAVFEKQPNAVQINIDTLVTEGFGNQPLFTCFVSLLEGQIVGMALCYFRFSTWKGRSVHLEDLIVKESKRGQGVGMALYKRVMEYAASFNVKRVEWVVLGWNTPAIKFYEKTGATILKDWYLAQFDQEGLSNFISPNS
ncbi:GNAT family N-acetyltransferase [Flavobacteriaceae bacterium]|nr:GNAT family N-acetyltransferase [Flavobacteriaceae bacterium]